MKKSIGTKAHSKAISFILVFAMILGLLPFNFPVVSVYGAVGSSSPSVWDGTIDISWYNETDTEFILTTAEQLAGLAAIVNNKPSNSNAGAVTGIDPDIPADDFLGKTIRLAADLDLGGIEITPAAINADATVFTHPVWEGRQWMPIGLNSSSNSANSNNGLR